MSKVVNNRRKKTSVLVALSSLVITACAQINGATESSDKPEWTYLLDSELTQWEIWSGVPHSSVKGLPEGTHVASNLNVHGDPKDAMGLNNDVKNVFSMTNVNGEPVLHITGEIYGGITTLASFENYHLSLQVKWGDKKWAPRLNAKKDSGLLYHCKGDHGAFWKVWKACQELQIQETDFGDYIPLAGPSGVVRSVKTADDKLQYHPQGELTFTKDYTHASIEPDYENGQWNTVELFTLNDVATFVVNGKVVMVVEQSKDSNGDVLNSGQLQLQSEGAEVFYKDVKIRSISELPSFM
jgi:hypothetical protein